MAPNNGMQPARKRPRAADAGRSPHGERPTVEDFGHRSNVLKRANVIRFTVAAMAAVVALSVPLAPDAQPTAGPVTIGVLCAGGCPFGGGSAADRPLIDALERGSSAARSA